MGVKILYYFKSVAFFSFFLLYRVLRNSCVYLSDILNVKDFEKKGRVFGIIKKLKRERIRACVSFFGSR